MQCEIKALISQAPHKVKGNWENQRAKVHSSDGWQKPKDTIQTNLYRKTQLLTELLMVLPEFLIIF